MKSDLAMLSIAKEHVTNEYFENSHILRKRRRASEPFENPASDTVDWELTLIYYLYNYTFIRS